jgi:hypothetical protein
VLLADEPTGNRPSPAADPQSVPPHHSAVRPCSWPHDAELIRAAPRVALHLEAASCALTGVMGTGPGPYPRGRRARPGGGPLASVAAIGVLGLTFALPGATLVVADGLAAGVRTWGEPGVLRVYLEEGRSMEEAEALAAQVRPRVEPGEVAVLAPATIQARFAERFPDLADLPGLLPAEPFPPQLEADASGLSPADRASLIASIEALEGVAAVVSDAVWSERLAGVAARLPARSGGADHGAGSGGGRGRRHPPVPGAPGRDRHMLVVGRRVSGSGPLVEVLLALGGATLGLLGLGGLHLVRGMLVSGPFRPGPCRCRPRPRPGPVRRGRPRQRRRGRAHSPDGGVTAGKARLCRLVADVEGRRRQPSVVGRSWCAGGQFISNAG